MTEDSSGHLLGISNSLYTDEEQAEVACSLLLHSIGENVGREGLIDTPKRVGRMYFELTTGLRTPAPKITCFDKGKNDQLITVLDIDFYSLCEHHLVPFYGRAHIGYLPDKQIAGLSKFGRIVDWFAKRPQIQEEMTANIADFIVEKVAPAGVIVVVEASHLCAMMRGVQKPNQLMVTSAIRGNIPKDEFFKMMEMRGSKK
jgi:GTP cyclohydrolase I